MNLTLKEVLNHNHTEESTKTLMIKIYKEETKDIFSPSSSFLKKHFINNVLTNKSEIQEISKMSEKDIPIFTTPYFRNLL